MRSTQMKRTDDLIRKVISEAILTKVRDPRIGLVSVIDVQVSPEFDTARVYVSVYGDESTREACMKGLKSAAPFLQGELAKSVKLKRTPRLRFIYDDSIERGFRIDSTLRDLSKAPPNVDSPEDDETANH